jgi:sugar lactone lactonase YvrE
MCAAAWVSRVCEDAMPLSYIYVLLAGWLNILNPRTLPLPSGNPTIRVSTLAGNGTSGSTDGDVAIATLDGSIFGVAVDSGGSVFISEHSAGIRRYDTATGMLDTLFGNFSGLNKPSGVTVDSNGNITVATNGDSQVRRFVIATGASTTLYHDPTVGASLGLVGIVVDATDRMYVSSTSHHIYQVIGSTLETFAGNGQAVLVDGNGTNAAFSNPYGMVMNSTGDVMFVADRSNHCVRQVVISTRTVTTFAGNGSQGWVDAVGTLARFRLPFGLAIDAIGNLFVSEFAGHVRQIVISTRLVSTLAGITRGFADGFGAAASLMTLRGLAIDARSNLFAVDSGNCRLRMIQAVTRCPAAYYCPAGAVAPIACGAGRFCGVAGLTAPIFCAPGFFCANGSAFTVRGAMDGQGMGIPGFRRLVSRYSVHSVSCPCPIFQSW